MQTVTVSDQVISNIISYKYITPILQSHTGAETTMVVTATSVIKVWRVNQVKDSRPQCWDF